MIKCQICGKEFIHFAKLARHIDLIHSELGQVEYYKKYISTDPMCGICLVCGKPLSSANTRFSFTRGFRRKVHRSCGTPTLEHWKKIYGDVDGTKKWENYCQLQSISNTYEYKKEKYGWTKEEFDKYNKSRSVTLKNMIKRHGKIEGEKLFKQYCEKQKTNGCSEEYFIEKYGEIDGKKFYSELNKRKSQTLENFIKKYGKEEGTKKFLEYKTKISNEHFYSKMSKELFDILIQNKSEEELKHIYYGDNEFGIYDCVSKKYFKYDYTDTNKKLIIEFNGTAFHPVSRFDENFKNPFEPELTAEEVWLKDQQKKACAINNGYNIYYIWENDYLNNKQKIIENFLKLI